MGINNLQVDEDGFPLKSVANEVDEDGFSLEPITSQVVANEVDEDGFPLEPKLAPFIDRLKYGFDAMLVDNVDTPNRSDVEGANIIADASDTEGSINIGEDFVYVRGNPIPITRTKEQQELRDKLARQKDDLPNLSSLIVGHEQEDGSFESKPKTAFEKRIKIINDKEKLELKKKYSYLTKEDKESPAVFVGNMAKIFWSPTTLFAGPLWKSKSIANAITKFSGTGAIWGSTYSAIDQTASKGKINKEDNIPPERKLNVKATPTEPNKLSIGVLINKVIIKLPIAWVGKYKSKDITGASTTNGNPILSQCAVIFAPISSILGPGNNSNCSKEPSS